MVDTHLQQTPLHDFHVEQGAKMGGFAEYSLPLFYPLGVMKEHVHTRTQAGLFDISHMVHVTVEGEEAARLISRLCPIDADDMRLGQARYTFFLNENAGVIDDLIVTRLGMKSYLIVCNAGRRAVDLAHIAKVSQTFDVATALLSRAFLALQGPAAQAVLNDLGFKVSGMAFMTSRTFDDDIFIARSGYTGEDGFEIALPNGDAAAFARKLVSDERVEMIGLGARDSLRLEAGLSLYGQDITEDVTPHEASLLWAIPKSLREGGRYIGANVMAQKIATGRTRRRVGLRAVGPVPVRAGALLENAKGEMIGKVTSGGYGPTIGGAIALALVELEAIDHEIFADVRGKKIEMAVAKLPFVPHNYKK